MELFVVRCDEKKGDFYAGTMEVRKIPSGYAFVQMLEGDIDELFLNKRYPEHYKRIKESQMNREHCFIGDSCRFGFTKEEAVEKLYTNLMQQVKRNDCCITELQSIEAKLQKIKEQPFDYSPDVFYAAKMILIDRWWREPDFSFYFSEIKVRETPQKYYFEKLLRGKIEAKYDYCFYPNWNRWKKDINKLINGECFCSTKDLAADYMLSVCKDKLKELKQQKARYNFIIFKIKEYTKGEHKHGVHSNICNRCNDRSIGRHEVSTERNGEASAQRAL